MLRIDVALGLVFRKLRSGSSTPVEPTNGILSESSAFLQTELGDFLIQET